MSAELFSCDDIRQIRRDQAGINLCLDHDCPRCWKGNREALRQHLIDNYEVDPMAYLAACMAGFM